MIRGWPADPACDPRARQARHRHANLGRIVGLLRYAAVMVNIGQGRLEVRGSRPDTAGQMTVVQRIYNTDNSFTDVPTSIAQQYAGDGHEHWHSLNMEGGALVRLDNGKRVGALAKHGFCFFDNVTFRLTLPGGAGHRPVHPRQQLCIR